MVTVREKGRGRVHLAIRTGEGYETVCGKGRGATLGAGLDLAETGKAPNCRDCLAWFIRQARVKALVAGWEVEIMEGEEKPTLSQFAFPVTIMARATLGKGDK